MSELFEGYPKRVLAKFKEWHQKNPQVYREFRRMANQIKATGRKRYSARTIMEALRWNHDLGTIGGVFELNDNFTPIYVRLLIHNHPEFDGFFELREVRSQGVFSQVERDREMAGAIR